MLVFLKKSKNFLLFRNQRFLTGFTLIELLVVVAIIGLLASMVSVVAREARNRGKDTKIQTSLSQVRFEAALIYNRDESYEDLCCTAATVPPCGDFNTLNNNNDNLRIIEDEARKYSDSDPDCYVSADGDSYCVQSPLVTGDSYCLDSTGYAGTIANCAAGNISCH
ncbi:type II secretion system protein [Patescibacteria group bacterium]|nr:type II secretion system protein [Patescibacteria group bacterium]